MMESFCFTVKVTALVGYQYMSLVYPASPAAAALSCQDDQFCNDLEKIKHILVLLMRINNLSRCTEIFLDYNTVHYLTN